MKGQRLITLLAVSFLLISTQPASATVIQQTDLKAQITGVEFSGFTPGQSINMQLECTNISGQTPILMQAVLRFSYTEKGVSVPIRDWKVFDIKAAKNNTPLQPQIIDPENNEEPNIVSPSDRAFQASIDVKPNEKVVFDLTADVPVPAGINQLFVTLSCVGKLKPNTAPYLYGYASGAITVLNNSTSSAAAKPPSEDTQSPSTLMQVLFALFFVIGVPAATAAASYYVLKKKNL
jgi:hypothetical protein